MSGDRADVAARPDREWVVSRRHDVVSLEVAGELVLLPLAADLGDVADDLFVVSGAGRLVWEALDGQADLGAVSERLADASGAPVGLVARDVLAFVERLVEVEAVQVLPGRSRTTDEQAS